MYSQILICASFLIASYQDIKERSVSDLVWVPALVGAAYVAFSAYPSLQFFATKVVLVGSIALVFTLAGYVGQADGIAFTIVAADPYPLSPIPPLFAAASVALGHILYEFAVGNARGKKTIPLERFMKEQRWIPKAVIKEGSREEVGRDVNLAREEVEARAPSSSMVEVTYGVPTVAYLGIGYLSYVVYLLVFNLPAFVSLP